MTAASRCRPNRLVAAPTARSRPGLLLVLAALGAPAAAATLGEPTLELGIPSELADTGLYADSASQRIAPDVLAFEPQYPLWSDGAKKRRWIRIPPGTAIDASDPDHFVFPAGTRLWKEFALERRVETRMLWLDAELGWRFATYVWSADESGATLAPEEGLPGACESAPGVPFDIPSRADCRACHDAGASPVLGFNALQLSPDRDPLAPHAVPPPPGAVDLAELLRLGLVRGLPQRFAESPPRIEADSPRERAALGYLSSNCGTCHTASGALAGLDLDLSYSLARPGGSQALATALERPSRFRWPGDVDPRRLSPSAKGLGILPRRMASRQPLSQMPPLGTHLRDEVALELVAAWIRDDLAPARRLAAAPSTPLPLTPNRDTPP